MCVFSVLKGNDDWRGFTAFRMENAACSDLCRVGAAVDFLRSAKYC